MEHRAASLGAEDGLYRGRYRRRGGEGWPVPYRRRAATVAGCRALRQLEHLPEVRIYLPLIMSAGRDALSELAIAVPAPWQGKHIFAGPRTYHQGFVVGCLSLPYPAPFSAEFT